jgi:hypothetical protein
MSETKTKTADERTQELEDKLIADREKWSTRILEMVKSLKQIDVLADAQVNMLSYRHMIVDQITDIQSVIYKKKEAYEIKYREKYIEYTTNGNLKLNGGEKDRFVKADLTPIQRQISLLESHLDFYRECIRTLDNSAFAIRNRIRLAEDDF